MIASDEQADAMAAYLIATIREIAAPERDGTIAEYGARAIGGRSASPSLSPSAANLWIVGFRYYVGRHVDLDAALSGGSRRRGQALCLLPPTCPLPAGGLLSANSSASAKAAGGPTFHHWRGIARTFISTPSVPNRSELGADWLASCASRSAKARQPFASRWTLTH